MVQQLMHHLRLAVHQFFGLAEVLGGAAFNHVRGKRPGAAGEADQRNAAIERAADGGHGIHHVIQVCFRIDFGQRGYVGSGADSVAEFRALAGFEVQAKPQRIGNGEDV